MMGSHAANVPMRGKLAAAIGAAALVGLTSTPPPATHNPALHAAVETAATLIAALAALLVYGRYTQTHQRSDLLLTASLGILAAASLGFGAVPALLPGAEPGPFAWAAVLTCAPAAGLMTAAAFLPAYEIRRPGRAARRWLAGCTLLVCSVAALAVVGGSALPAPVRPGSGSTHAFAAHPVMVVSEAVLAVLFAAAAIGFARRFARDHDRLMAWFAIGAVFGAFARLNYLIHPSALTVWFTVGDILRLAFLVCLLAGGAAAIRRVQRALVAAAVDEERERIARDLHDGTAQDLAFILQAGRHLAGREGTPEPFDHLVTAAQHALDYTRYAVANLAWSGAGPLTGALRRAAQEVADREGVQAEVEGPADLHVPPATREALCLLVREAVTNAIRHGGAGSVRVTVDAAPQLRIRVEDDGRGFQPEQLRGAVGHFGITGMNRRVAVLGGELRVSSKPGAGTQVLVLLP